jgi:lipopolysaccharide transport system ATP-binding protein
VGDAEFQKKCLGKMGDVAGEGRTVLFVSHNMAAVQQLCENAFLIKNGRIVSKGLSSDVVSEYLNAYSNQDGNPFSDDNPDRSGNGSIRLVNGRILDVNGIETTTVIAGNDITLEFDYKNLSDVKATSISLTIYNQFGLAVTSIVTALTIGEIANLGRKGTIRCVLTRTPFPLGNYRVAIALHSSGELADHIHNALLFQVESSIFFPSMRTPNNRFCAIMIEHQWEHKSLG